MGINEVKAKAYDSIVTAFYGQKLTQTYVEALITFVNQFEPITTKSTTLTVEPVEKPVEEEKPKEKPKAKTTKAKTGGGKSKLDDGKIKALYEAGWNLAKIADEMGCSAVTINNHLVNMGIRKG